MTGKHLRIALVIAATITLLALGGYVGFTELLPGLVSSGFTNIP